MNLMSSARLSNGDAFDILKLKVTKHAGTAQPLPVRLSRIQPIGAKGAKMRTIDLKYVFHCHNLEHEDNDMMVNMRVRA